MDKVRKEALNILYETDVNSAYMNILIAAGCKNKNFDSRDSAFLSEIVRGTVRNRGQIDYIIGLYSKVKIKKISPWILNILRMGVYQLKFMDKVPQSAAVNESVILAKKYGHSSSAGFVNALMRKIASVKEIPMPEDRIKYLSVYYSYPENLTKKLILDYGEEKAKEIMHNGNMYADTVIRTNTLKITPDELENRLKDMVLKRHGNMIHIRLSGAIENLPEFKEGLFTVQAEPFNRTCELLGLSPGMKVLDACAAPGGKTTYIAELMKNKGEVYAFDIYEHKLKLINETSNRLGINIIKTELHDSKNTRSDLVSSFDRILLDVPCSGSGIIRRRPDIKWHRKDEDFSKVQKKILESMSGNLKNDGILVYSTCSIDKRENEEVVNDFLSRHDEFYKIPFEESETGEKTWYPGENGCDGAYICKMGRK